PFVRPEGFALSWLMTAIAWANGQRHSGSPRESARYAIPLVLTNLAAAAAITGFRWSYFGYPLPNTFYAKVSHNLLHNLASGMGYIGRFFYDNAFYAIIFALVLAAVVYALAETRRKFHGSVGSALTALNDRSFATLAGFLVIL